MVIAILGARVWTVFLAQEEFAAGFRSIQAHNEAREGTLSCGRREPLVFKLISSLRGARSWVVR